MRTDRQLARHDHRDCIESALSQADLVCSRAGARLTELRRKVLEYVWQGHQAVKAYDILAQLGDDRGAAKPPTVYRALQFLQQVGLVHRLESMNAYVGCSGPEDRHAGQFFICTECGLVREFHAPDIGVAVEAHAARTGFAIQRQTLEVLGQCRACGSEAQ